MGLIGLAACGRTGQRTVYRYPETEVLFDSFHIKKAVYSPGELKLYYKGGNLKDNQIKCYGADFSDLGDEFESTFKNGVLTVRADFASQISGLTIYNTDNGVIYHLRYLDSPQFAWLAETLWLDYGWCKMGDEQRFYSAEELKEQADSQAAKRQETTDTFKILEGTWISEDGLRKYVFTADEEAARFAAEDMWFNGEKQAWEGRSLSVEAAYQSKYYDEECGDCENIREITLVNGDRSAANMIILYNQQEKTIRSGDAVYHRD